MEGLSEIGYNYTDIGSEFARRNIKLYIDAWHELRLCTHLPLCVTLKLAILINAGCKT